MTKRKSTKRKAAESGRWPVADPEPYIIDVLRRMSHWKDAAVMPADAQGKLLDEVQAILAEWHESEDIDGLRNRLGVNLGRKRRRTQRQVDREYAIALAYAEHIARETRDPFAQVMHEFGCERRTIERALEGWGRMTANIVRLAREQFPGMSLDYSGLKRTRTRQ